MAITKIALMTLFLATVLMGTSAVNSDVNNRKLLDAKILLKVDSSLGECWGRFCAPWSPCQSGCYCVGEAGLGACVGLSTATDAKIDNTKMVNSGIVLKQAEHALGQCIGKGCAPWSPCQSGCSCVGAGGFGACVGPSFEYTN